MFVARHVSPPGGAGWAFTSRDGGVSEGSMGPLNLGRGGVDSTEHLVGNFDAVRSALGLGAVITLHQVHGADVLVVDEDLADSWGPRHHVGEPAGAPALPVADAMVTAVRRTPPVALCIRVADCVPVLLVDEAHGVVGAAHAGRAGFEAGVLAATVGTMREKGAQTIRALIGPHICGGCYEVPATLRDQVGAVAPASVATTTWGTPSLDLGAGCEAQLDGLGCTVTRIDPCTRTTDSLHSHRRDGDGAGRLGAFVWLG